MAFEQQDFEYKSLFEENSYLQDVVNHFIDDSYQNTVSQDLTQFSQKAKGEYLNYMLSAERNPPQFIQFDHWGKRIDKIHVDSGWEKLHQVSSSEGIVAIGYERKSKEYSRLHQFLKLLIFHPSSAFYTCPLAMTDGAARVLELENDHLHKKYINHLTSRTPCDFYTAGQWMTEKAGGSDVSQSETVAEFQDGKYYLYGEKWFTSAITANIAMTLAQTEVGGKKQLSMFMVKIRNEAGELNNIEVLRLKDKLGTKAMPTAELKLNGVEGHPIGELGKGVKNITTVLNISRLYNAVCATGTMYRLHSLVRDYSKKRFAFGKTLIDHPLHQRMLITTQADTNGAVLFCAEMGRLLGKSELKLATPEEESLLRFMTPIAKLWTGKKSVSTVSELIEAFGGAGYIEDTELPRFLRDAQVFSIWEGTTNIMSLDTLRALSKGTVMTDVFKSISQRVQNLEDPDKLNFTLEKCKNWFSLNMKKPTTLEWGARTFSFTMGNIFAGLLLCEFTKGTGKQRDQLLAQTFLNSMTQVDFENENINFTEIKTALML